MAHHLRKPLVDSVSNSPPENIWMGLWPEFVKNIDSYLGVDGEPVGLLFREQGYMLATADAMPMCVRRMPFRLNTVPRMTKSLEDLAAEFPWVGREEIEGALVSLTKLVDPYMLLQALKSEAASGWNSSRTKRCVSTPRTVVPPGNIRRVGRGRSRFFGQRRRLRSARVGADGGRGAATRIEVALHVCVRVSRRFRSCAADHSAKQLRVAARGRRYLTSFAPA